jgi:hypothetical protein
MRGQSFAPSSTKAEKTGGSNTRLNSQAASTGIEVSIDWLQFAGSIPEDDLIEIFKNLEQRTGEKFELKPGKPTMCGRAWENSGRSPNGIKVAWDSQIDKDGKLRCFIAIPGGVLSALEPKIIWFLAKHLRDLGFNCSRNDIAVDDFKKRLDRIKIIEALRMRNYSKFSKKRVVDSFDEEWSLYFGNRESARFSRLYNKDAQSKGKIKSFRLETQFNAKVANIVLDKWLAIDPEKLGDRWESESAKYLMQSVLGSIDFVDRVSNPSEKNVSRLKQLDWWESFCELAGGIIYHTAPVPKQSLERKAGWMKRSVFKSMKCVMEAMGKEAAIQWLEDSLKRAGEELSSWHRILIQQFSLEWEAHKNNSIYGVPEYA